MRGLATATLVLLAAIPAAAQEAAAQELDCGNVTSTPELNACAAQDLERADQILNRAYAMALEVAQGRGAAQEASLREAQRAWIAFRDRACEAEALLFEGGTAQPLTGTACLERLSSVRTGDLRRYVGLTLP